MMILFNMIEGMGWRLGIGRGLVVRMRVTLGLR